MNLAFRRHCNCGSRCARPSAYWGERGPLVAPSFLGLCQFCGDAFCARGSDPSHVQSQPKSWVAGHDTKAHRRSQCRISCCSPYPIKIQVSQTTMRTRAPRSSKCLYACSTKPTATGAVTFTWPKIGNTWPPSPAMRAFWFTVINKVRLRLVITNARAVIETFLD